MSTELTGVQNETTRIHNIGYRNYEGPRLGRAYARRSLYCLPLCACCISSSTVY